MRPLNPQGMAKRKPHIETTVAENRGVRVTCLRADNDVAQNITLGPAEFEAVFGSLIDDGAGQQLEPILDALRERGLLPAPKPADKLDADQEREETVAEVLERAQGIVFGSAENLRAFVDLIGSDNLVELIEALGASKTLATGAADEAEGEPAAPTPEQIDAYFKNLVATVAETPEHLNALNRQLEAAGYFPTALGFDAQATPDPGNEFAKVLASVPDPDGTPCGCQRPAGTGPEITPDPATEIGRGLLELPPEAVQVDVTALASGGQQIAIRIQPPPTADDPDVALIEAYLEFCRARGVKIKKRKQRAGS